MTDDQLAEIERRRRTYDLREKDLGEAREALREAILAAVPPGEDLPHGRQSAVARASGYTREYIATLRKEAIAKETPDV